LEDFDIEYLHQRRPIGKQAISVFCLKEAGDLHVVSVDSRKRVLGGHDGTCRRTLMISCV